MFAEKRDEDAAAKSRAHMNTTGHIVVLQRVKMEWEIG